MIQLTNVSKNFGKLQAVSQVNLEVAAGDIFGLVGPDGAGKTTTIRMILGLIDKTEGGIVVMGETDFEKIKPHIGYVPQKFSLYGDLTVFENIRFIGSMYGASQQKINSLAKEILSFTNLFPFKDRLAANLSGGMKQKLALAAGLMHRPKLFFLDEPTTGVDPVSRREFWQMLYRLNKEGMTILVSTPYMDEAELCTKIAFMDRGRMVACDTPRALKIQYPYKIMELTASHKELRSYLNNCPGLVDINAFGEKYHLVVDDPAQVVSVVKERLQAAGITLNSFQEIAPTIEDIFVAFAKEVPFQ